MMKITWKYRRMGNGPTLVLVHGYLGGSAQWDAQIEHLQDRFDVIAADLPGFADASAMQGVAQISDFATSVLSFLDDLGIESFFLLGHSMGGMIAQEMAVIAPTRIERLILYATGANGLMPHRFESIEASREKLLCDGVPATARRIAATWFVEGENAYNFSTVVGLGAQASVQAATAALDAMRKWDGQKALAEIDMPTLIIWGERDQSYRWSQIEILWRNLPHASLAVMPGSAHAAHLEKPALFHAIVDDFLKP